MTVQFHPCFNVYIRVYGRSDDIFASHSIVKAKLSIYVPLSVLKYGWYYAFAPIMGEEHIPVFLKNYHLRLTPINFGISLNPPFLGLLLQSLSPPLRKVRSQNVRCATYVDVWTIMIRFLSILDHYPE